MSAWKLRILALNCLVSLFAGCAIVTPGNGFFRVTSSDSEPSPPIQYTSSRAGEDEQDGWLWRRLNGQNQPSQSQPTTVSQATSAEALGIAQPAVDPLAPNGVAVGAGVVDFTPEATKASSVRKKPAGESSESILDALSPSNIYSNMKSAVGLGPNEQVARSAFEEGSRLFQAKSYDEAAKQFAVAADRWPDTAMEEDALFMLAESYFFADRYPQAHETYEKLLKKYEYSRYLDTAARREFAIGRFWEKHNEAEPHWPITPNFTDKTRPWFDTKGNALKCYEHTRMNDPTGPLADDSLMAVAGAHFMDGNYEEAAYQYDILRKEYANSEHQLNAHLLAREAKVRVYQGELYDGTPLKEAGEIADQTLMRFGNTLGAERQRVIDEKNKIIEAQARRDLAVGNYWDNKHHYRAARIYYQNVLDKFPQTMAAQEARQRLEQIQGYPDEPPNYFGWLEELAGSKKKY